MILRREATRTDGTKFMQRMVWKNIAANELDWSWEASRDGGKTWQVQLADPLQAQKLIACSTPDYFCNQHVIPRRSQKHPRRVRVHNH